MLLTIGIVLLVLWAFGFLALKVASGLIHLLILLAIGAFVLHLFRNRGRGLR